MPRPKQSRAARQQKSAAQPQPAAAAVQGKQPREASSNKNGIIPASAPTQAQDMVVDSDDLYSNSDRDRELLRRQKQAGVAVEDRQDADADASASSPIPTTEGRATRLRTSKLGTTPIQRRLLEQASRDADRAVQRLRAEDTATSASDPVNEEEPARGQPRRSAHAVAARVISATPLNHGDVTGMELTDLEMFGDIESSFDANDEEDALDQNRHNNSSSTAGAADLTQQYRRRPRQSSFVGPGEPPIRPSSRGLATPGVSSTLNIGAFKRRPREPSILGTSRKPMREHESADERVGGEQQQGGRQVLDSDSDSDPSSDLPLSLEQSTPVTPSAPPPRLRSGSVTTTTTTTTRGRKRKNTNGPAAETRPEKTPRISLEDQLDVTDGVDEGADSDNSSLLSSLPSPLGPLPSTNGRPHMPVEDDRVIMAPPASSGSDDDNGESVWPDVRALVKRRRRFGPVTPLAIDKGADRQGEDSDFSSPPSLTHSPNVRPRGRQKGRARTTARRPSPKLTTADLASLLPKRRRRQRRRRARAAGGGGNGDGNGEDDDEDEEEDDDDEQEHFDLSALGPDEDELAHAGDAKTRRRPGRSAASKTYSRRLSDKENDVRSGHRPEDAGPETADEPSGLAATEEIKKAVKKFKEVDRWELEFEEDMRSPSPADAR